MTDSIISLRISKETLEKMRANDEINWSAFLRNCLNRELRQIQDTENDFDKEKMRKAEEIMDKIRNSDKGKAGGKSGAEIIREWRNRRR